MPLTCWQASPPIDNTSMKNSWGHGEIVPKKESPGMAMVTSRSMAIVAICSPFPPPKRIIESEITPLSCFKSERGVPSSEPIDHKPLFIFFIELFPPQCLFQQLLLALQINVVHPITCHVQLKPHPCLHERLQRTPCPKGVMQMRPQWFSSPCSHTIEVAGNP